jgi:hypothetical protein
MKIDIYFSQWKKEKYLLFISSMSSMSSIEKSKTGVSVYIALFLYDIVASIYIGVASDDNVGISNIAVTTAVVCHTACALMELLIFANYADLHSTDVPNKLVMTLRFAGSMFGILSIVALTHVNKTEHYTLSQVLLFDSIASIITYCLTILFICKICWERYYSKESYRQMDMYGSMETSENV